MRATSVVGLHWRAFASMDGREFPGETSSLPTNLQPFSNTQTVLDCRHERPRGRLRLRWQATLCLHFHGRHRHPDPGPPASLHRSVRASLLPVRKSTGSLPSTDHRESSWRHTDRHRQNSNIPPALCVSRCESMHHTDGPAVPLFRLFAAHTT